MRGKVTAVAICAAIFIMTVGVGPAQAVGAGCTPIDYTFNIQEGAINIDTAKVDIVGQVCTVTGGGLNNTKTELAISLRATPYATTFLEASYWSRGTLEISNDNARETWRFYGAYQSCFFKYIGWICGPGNPRFHFDVTALVIPSVGRGISYSASIVNDNVYSHARWS